MLIGAHSVSRVRAGITDVVAQLTEHNCDVHGKENGVEKVMLAREY